MKHLYQKCASSFIAAVAADLGSLSARRYRESQLPLYLYGCPGMVTVARGLPGLGMELLSPEQVPLLWNPLAMSRWIGERLGRAPIINPETNETEVVDG